MTRPRPTPAVSRRAALAPDAMKGPKRAAVAILAFFGSSVVAVHLAYHRELPPAPAAAADAPVGSPPAVTVAAPAAAEAPAAALAPARDRDLTACVERALRDDRQAEEKPVLPGRWPALKRAREVRRLRQVALRAECERRLAAEGAQGGDPLTAVGP